MYKLKPLYIRQRLEMNADEMVETVDGLSAAQANKG